MNITKNSIIGEVVAQDYRTASVFGQFGMDFCCNGNRSIETACAKLEMQPDALVSAIQEILNAADGDQPARDYLSWPLDLLADFIEKKHHRYVTEQIPVIQAFLEKLVNRHGAHHPELLQIKALFDTSAGELTAHMKKEELILFPYVHHMIREKQAGNFSLSAPFGTVQNPIRMMMQEHDIEGENFRQIRALSNQYTPPEDACNTYRVTFAHLQAFEEDLHLHIHLENNILFPKAIALESTFSH